MKNLYIQTAFLGDLLLALPVLRQIRYWDSKSSLTVLCRKGYGSLLEKLEVCDEVVELDKGDKLKARKILQKDNYKTIFCAHQSWSTHQLVKALKADIKIGYRRFWNKGYFDRRVKRCLVWPEVIRQMQLLEPMDQSLTLKLEAFSQDPLGLPAWSQMKNNSSVFRDSDIQSLLQKKVGTQKLTHPLVCLAPGSVWPTKRWTKSGFMQVGLALNRKGYQVALLGASNERSLCEELHNEIPNSLMLAGHLNIFESLMILSRAKGLICNDSGAMHLASLLNLPTLALFGPTVQELGYKPWNPNAQVIERKGLLCRPCGQHGAINCPIGTHICMSGIDPMDVFDRALILFS